MTERIRAFGPKIEKEKGSSAQEKSEKTEGPLQSLEKDKAQISGFNFALNLILDGTITDVEQLKAIANPRFDSEADNAYLRTNNNIVIPFANDFIRRRTLKGKEIIGEDSGLLTRLLNTTSNTAFPNEVKENLKKYVQTNDAKVLERLNTILASSENEQMSSEVSSVVSDLINTKRIAELKKDVYGGIVENKSNGELSARISEFEGKETADLELVGELQTAVAARRKRDIVSSANRSLQLQGRDIDAVIADVTPLLGSKRPDEREAGLQLVKTAYIAELANFKNEVQKMITGKADPEMLRIYIDGLPIRPSVGEIDYVQTVVETREKAFQSVGEILKVNSIGKAVEIRENFATKEVDAVLADIDNFPGETDRGRAIKIQLLELYRSYVAANRTGVFDERFAAEIQQKATEQLQAKFVSPELGKNRDAFRYIRDRFEASIGPLFESLRADETTSARINSFFEPDKKSGMSPRRQFEQRLSAFEKQRQLTDVERNYLQSVSRLSLINPYLVACAYTDPAITSEFLRHHFETISTETAANLKDGDYFPLIQIGLGPNGLAALGETVRNNPDLASAMLVVDAGKQPGGPFAIPEGAAWRLNSANKRGSKARTLPDKPGSNELKTIRAYGSPVRLTPGERVADEDIRTGSINTTVDYLLTPDDLPTSRYPTNEELQLVLALQGAVLTKNVALQTKVIGLEKNLDPHAQGDKSVTLEITNGTGVRRVKIATDAIFAPTGLGESGYGFRLEGSRAEKIISETEDSSRFPKLSKTLEAFRAFAGRSNEQVSPGETLVIYGGGNSADTLIEYVGNLFQGDNPLVSDITKIYLITEKDLSNRPRYKLIEDLRGRNGRGNLIEQIRTKVGDVDFETTEGELSERKLVFYDRNNQLIKNEKGVVITANSAIAATGFRSQVDILVENYARDLAGGTQEALREPLTLPTNETVSVAETLKSDPSVLILGVASDADFENVDKLAQLQSVESREALLRNGAENAVAIGFRAPDTQAAVNVWLNSRDIRIETKPDTSVRETLMVSGTDNISPGETIELDRIDPTKNTRIPNNIRDETRFLSPLFGYNVGNTIELTDPNGQKFTGELDFTISYNPETQTLGLTLNKDNSIPVSREVLGAVKKACTDDDFQRYALVALKKKRRNPKLDLVLSFKNGLVDPGTTFVQS